MDRQQLIKLESELYELYEYFDQRSDADCDQDGYIPNEEMKFMTLCDEMLKDVQKEIQKDIYS